MYSTNDENQKKKSSTKEEIGEDISRRQIKEYKNVINLEESLPHEKHSLKIGLGRIACLVFRKSLT